MIERELDLLRVENRELRERLRALEVEACALLASRLGDDTAEQGDALLIDVARGISETTGQSFFKTLVGNLARVLRADCAFVAELLPGPVERARTIASTADGAETPDFQYDLAGTPCEHVIHRAPCSFPCDVQQRFPSDTLLAAMGAEAYVGAPLFDARGAPLGVLVVMWRAPISDPRQAEMTLRIFALRAAGELERLRSEASHSQRESLLRSIIDHTTAMIYVVGGDGRLLLTNREFHKAVAPSGEAELRRQALAVLESGRPSQREEELSGPNGEQRTYLSVKVPLRDGDGTPFGVANISTDITEHKRMQAQLLQVQRMESIGRLAGGIAHEFNNLLTAIGGFTDMALSTLAADHPARPDLGESQLATERAAALTSQLLSFARKQIITPQVVDLSAISGTVVKMLEPIVGESIALALQCDDQLWPVLVDPSQIEQVLLDLALNGRDAMPAGGRLTIRLANLRLDAPLMRHGCLVAPGDYVAMTVSDTGAGIEDELQGRLFEPFSRSNGAGHGSGLGLATSHGIIQQMSGLMDFDSTAGVGTTFRVLLPRAAAAPDQAASQPERNDGRPVAGHETILLVEDERAVRDFAARVLRDAGYDVLTAQSAEAALELLEARKRPVDLLLTDLMLPGIDGFQLARRFGETHPRAPVLYASGYSEEAFGRSASFDPETFLYKPYSSQQLARMVRSVLDRVADRATSVA